MGSVGDGKIETGQRLRSWPTGEGLFRQLADEQGGRAFLLSFSRGKDSIAAAIALQDAGFPVVPFYCERIPGLSFVDESLDYYERELFGGLKIVKAMHPATARQLKAGTFHPPHFLPVDDAMGLAEFEYADVQAVAGFNAGLPEKTFTATGLRAADSVLRRTNFAKSGPTNRTKRTFGPIWDWNLDRVMDVITGRGVKLPADYRLFGRTFDGLMGEFLAPLKWHLPADYAKVLELFPLADVEVWRYEKAHGTCAPRLL